MSSEERELDLVDKVDFRILNVANNEVKLQDMLGKYLAPLLLKAGSEHASVRSKVRFVFGSAWCRFVWSPRGGDTKYLWLGHHNCSETEDIHTTCRVSY